jgi:tape measure domain-containing protein
MSNQEFAQANVEVEQNKNLVAFKRKIDNETPNIERTYRAILGEDVSSKGYAYYDKTEYQVRANEHLTGLIDYLENGILKDASDSEKASATSYLELLKKLKNTILQVGETGNFNSPDIAEAEQLLGINLKEYKSILSKNETLNVKDRQKEIQASAIKARKGKNTKQFVMDVKPELEAYIWAINQELIKEGKQQIDIKTAEYLGSGYKNHAIKASGVVYKFARHTNPLAAKVNKMMGGKGEKKYQGEVAALKKLQGENAPEFVASGENFMAMSEAQGVTLKEALETASVKEKKELLQKAAKLLKSFHDKGLAHFDFHPGNIIKKTDGSLAAIDWESGELTKDKKRQFEDKKVAISRFQDVLPRSINTDSLFNVAYLGSEITESVAQIKDNYRNMLKRLIRSGAQEAERRFQGQEGGIFIFDDLTGQLVDGTDIARLNFNQLAQDYRDAVKAGDESLMDELGKTLLFQSELLKRAYVKAAEGVESESELRKLRGYSGYVTSVQTEILEGNPGSKSRANVSLVDSMNSNDQLKSIVENSYLGEDIKSGVEEVLDRSSGRVIGYQFVLGINQGGQDAADINSPSKVWQWIGEMIKAGFNGGVAGIGNFLSESIQGAGDDARQRVREVANSVSNAAQSLDNSRGLLDPLFETEGADIAVNDFFGNLIKKVSDTFDDLKSKFPVIGRIVDFLGSIGSEVLQVLGIFRLGEALIGFSTVALDTAMKMESLERSIIAVSNSAADGAKNISFVKKEAQRLSIDINTAADAYKRLLGATRNTALEGLQTEKLFTTLATTARNRGLTPDATSRLFLGFEQVIAKNEYKSEEVRGQLAEVLGDIQNLLASAIGVPINQLSELMESGALKAAEVTPKLMALLDAQNALGRSANTAQAAQTRFNNSILQFQDAVGRQLLPTQKLGLNALAAILGVLQNQAQVLIKLVTGLVTTVLVNLTLKLLATKLVTFALGDAIYRLGFALGAVLPKLIAFAAKFALITIAIEVWGNVIDRAKNSHLVLSDDIKVSTKRLEALKKAFDGAGDAADNFKQKQPKQLQLNEGAEVGNWTPGNGKFLKAIAGGDRWNLDNFFNNRIQRFYDAQFNGAEGFYKAIGLGEETKGLRNLAARNRPQTYAQQKQNDFINETSTLVSNIDNTLLYGNQAKSVLEDLAKIDTKARDLQSQKGNVLPGDSAGLKKALKAEQAVLAERDKLVAKSAQYQEALPANIEDAKNRLSRLDELDNTGGTQEEIDQRENLKKSLSERIKALESEKKVIDEINARIPKFLSQVNRLLRNSDERVKGFIGNQEDNAVVNRNEVISDALANGLSDAQLELKLDNLSSSDLKERISFINQEIKSLEAKLSNAYLKEGVAGLQRSAEAEGVSLNPDTLERMAGEGRSSAETEAANVLLALNEYQGILAESESGLLDSIKTNRDKFKQFNKTIADYFYRLTQQIKEATLETQRLLSNIFYTDIKNKLLGALAPGSNTFVSGIIDNVQSIIDQAGQVAQKIFGDSAAQLGFESETRTLATEMQDFIKEVEGASSALQNFANKLNGTQNSDNNKSADNLTALRRAIIGKESNTNFKAVNPDSGALGYGQVMPANVKSWTKQALGRSLTPDQFLNDSLAQVEVINYKLNEYLQKELKQGFDLDTAVRRVASTWYSGQPGKYNDTKAQSYNGGKYPSIDSYTKDILTRFKSEGGGGTKTSSLLPDQVNFGRVFGGKLPTEKPTAGTKILARRSGQKTDSGMELISYSLLKNGEVIDSFTNGYSGVSSKQIFDQKSNHIAKSLTPLPDGNWKINVNQASSVAQGKSNNDPNSAVGKYWIGMEPQFKTNRSAIGMHLENDVLGSAGCLVFTDPSSISKLAGWVKDNNVNDIYVDLQNVDVEREAKAKNQELVTAKAQNLELTKAQTEQLRESLSTEAKNKIELNKRQGKEGRQESDAAVLGIEDKIFGFKNQYGYQSAIAELTNNLRSVKQQFIDADLDIASQITNTEDAILSITNSIPVLTEQIAKFKAIGSPEAILAASVQQSALDELSKTLPTLQSNLEKIKATSLEIPKLEQQAAHWTREQGKLKIEQEKLTKENIILEQQANLAAQRGTLEQRRQLKLKQEEQRLELAINQIRQNTPEGSQRNEEILGELRQSKVNKENIDYEARFEESDIERRLLDYQSGIEDKNAGFLSRYGFNIQADKLRRDGAIASENNRFQKELLQIEKDFAGDPEKLAEFAQLAKELNRINLQGINQQFKSLRTTIEDFGISAIQGFFTQFTTNFFDGVQQRDRALVEERLRYAEEVVGLENQYREEPGKLAHLKNRARELNEQKLSGITGEFSLFGRAVDLAKQALLEFVKQLAVMVAQQAAAKFVTSILGNALGGAIASPISVGNDYGSGAGVAAFTASEGITVGSIKKRKLSDQLSSRMRNNYPGIAKAWSAEGSGAQLGVFHTGEELLSRKTGEAGRYQALKAKLGINPLDKIGSATRWSASTPKAGEEQGSSTSFGGRTAPALGVFANGGSVGLDVSANLRTRLPRFPRQLDTSVLSGFNNFSSPRIDLSGIKQNGRSNSDRLRKTVNINQTIVSPNADSFRANADQRNQDLIESLRRGF